MPRQTKPQAKFFPNRQPNPTNTNKMLNRCKTLGKLKNKLHNRQLSQPSQRLLNARFPKPANQKNYPPPNRTTNGHLNPRLNRAFERPPSFPAPLPRPQGIHLWTAQRAYRARGSHVAPPPKVVSFDELKPPPSSPFRGSSSASKPKKPSKSCKKKLANQLDFSFSRSLPIFGEVVRLSGLSLNITV